MDGVADAAGLVKESEGLSLALYTCPAGKLSIGYGRNLEDNGITQNEAEYLLVSDLSRTARELSGYRWFDQMNDARRAALIDMHYNLGAVKFREFKRMIFALEQSDYVTAAKEMLNSKWATQYPGTKVRALRDAKILKNGGL